MLARGLWNEGKGGYRMIWLCIVLYIVMGFVCLLVGQILNCKGLDKIGLFDPVDDVLVFRVVAMAVVLCWPVYAIVYTVTLFIPWLILSAYKLFVGIIFGTIALFKKEKWKDG